MPEQTASVESDTERLALLGRLSEAVRRHQVVAFVVLAFAWSWGYDGLTYVLAGPSGGPFFATAPRTWGPLVAAGVVTWASAGDVREWAGQVTDWRVAPRWYLFAVAFPVVVTDLGPLLAGAFGLEVTGPRHALYEYLLHALYVLVLAGGLEELGWRGFAQPRLQERYSALAAAVGIGFVWALWHLPLFVLFDNGAYSATGPFVARYLTIVVGLSVVYAAVYNATDGALLPVMVAHAVGNNAGFLRVVEQPTGIAASVVEHAGVAAYALLALGFVLAYGGRYLARSGPHPAVPGRGE